MMRFIEKWNNMEITLAHNVFRYIKEGGNSVEHGENSQKLEWLVTIKKENKSL